MPRSTISRPMILRLGPPWPAPRASASRPMKSPLSSLSQRVEAGFEDVDLFRDFVAVEAHARFEAQRVARAQAAGPDAELRARFEQRVPHLHGGGLVGGDVDLEAVFAGVAGARDQHVGNAGDRAPGEPVILDGGQIDLGQLGERLKRARALQGELRVVAGVVAEMNAGPARRPAA